MYDIRCILYSYEVLLAMYFVGGYAGYEVKKNVECHPTPKGDLD